MKKMAKEKEPPVVTSGEPLNQEQLAELLGQVVSGQKPVEMFIAELARSASSLTENGLKMLEKLKNSPPKED